MSARRTAILAAIALGLAAGPAGAEPLSLRIHGAEQPLLVSHPWHLAGNPNVTPDNPMGVVGWDGPPDYFNPGVIGEAGPLPPGSIANAPTGGWYDYY